MPVRVVYRRPRKPHDLFLALVVPDLSVVPFVLPSGSVPVANLFAPTESLVVAEPPVRVLLAFWQLFFARPGPAPVPVVLRRVVRGAAL